MTTSINAEGRITRLNLLIDEQVVIASIHAQDKRTIKANKIRFGGARYPIRELPNRTDVYIARSQDGRLIAVNKQVTKWEVLSEVSQ